MGMAKTEVCSCNLGYWSQSLPAHPANCCGLACWWWVHHRSLLPRVEPGMPQGCPEWLLQMFLNVYVTHVATLRLSSKWCSGEAAGLTCPLWRHPGVLRIELQQRPCQPGCKTYLGTWLINTFCHPQQHLSFQNVQLRCTEVETCKGTE